VALLPFARNESTRFISPTKTPEYLAAGRPVVSTSIRDVVRPYGEAGLVRIADTPAEFVDEAELLLNLGCNAEWLTRVDDHLKSMSWNRTWEAMKVLIDEAIVNRKRADAKPSIRVVIDSSKKGREAHV
jgi:UDP-galactopyranose mutase